MKLQRLDLRYFGPFQSYTVSFGQTDDLSLLLTGKNNEGKSNLILALRFLHFATQVLGQPRQRIEVDDEECYRLHQQDIGDARIGRLVYNYMNEKATIHGTFDDGLQVIITLDPEEEMVYARHLGRLPHDLAGIFGFIPPLGGIAESEPLLSERHVRVSQDSTLAPRHLRNHLYQLLSDEDFRLVQQIIQQSWSGVELLKIEFDRATNQLNCFYREGRFEREISWAGQGLQIWFQIVTHMVRLRKRPVLVLDEPEVNLHPEKQHDLMRLLRDYHEGSIIVATHSVELMNNVNVSHIIHVEKEKTAPKVKSTGDRAFLDRVRSAIGSNFNLIASQFEEVDVVLFTEDRSDYDVLAASLRRYGYNARLFSIPIYGFQEYRKSKHYKDAYELLIGKGKAKYTLVLDRDYYPPEYLEKISEELGAIEIRVVYTPGKEIENLFLTPGCLERMIPDVRREAWREFMDKLYASEYVDNLSTAVKLYSDFSTKGTDTKSATIQLLPQFNEQWNDPNSRYKLIHGKNALKKIRLYFQKELRVTLTESALVESLGAASLPEVGRFLARVGHSE